MEIFRKDGGGRTENHPRLIKVIGNVMNIIASNTAVWGEVVSVADEKGKLTITLQKPLKDTFLEAKLLTVFVREWEKAGESPWSVFLEYKS